MIFSMSKVAAAIIEEHKQRNKSSHSTEID